MMVAVFSRLIFSRKEFRRMKTISSIQALENTLKSAVGSDGALQAKAASISPALVTCFENFLTNQTLVIGGATITASTKNVTVTGTGPAAGPFAGTSVSAVFTLANGDVDVLITATAPQGWTLATAFPILASTFFAQLQVSAGAVLTLESAAGTGGPSGKLSFAGTVQLSTFAPDLSQIVGGSLAINGSISAAKGQPTSLALSTAAGGSWTIPVGPNGLSLTAGKVAFNYAGGKATGQLTGKLQVDSIVISANGVIPGALVIKGSTNGASLKSLAGGFSSAAPPVPSGLDMTLPQCAVVISKQAADFTFDLGGAVQNIGSAVFSVQRSAGKWGYGLGVDVSVANLSSLAGLELLKPVEAAFPLQNVLLVIGSALDANFAFPDASTFTDPTIPVKVITLPARAGGLQAGLNIYAEVDLGAYAQTKPFIQLVGLTGLLDVTVQVPADPAAGASLAASLTGAYKGVQITGALEASFKSDQPSFAFSGDAKTSIQGQPVDFAVVAAFVLNGVFLSGSFAGTITFGPVTLSNLALEIGVDEELVPSLGVAGQIDVGNFESSIAIFFDSAVPSNSMFAGSVSDIDLGVVVNTFAGTLNTAIPPNIKAVLSQIALKGTTAFSLPAALGTALANRDAAAVSAAFAPQVSVPATSDQLFIIKGQTDGYWFVTDVANMEHYAIAPQTGGGYAVTREVQVYFAPQPTTVGGISFPPGMKLNGQLEFLFLQVIADVDVSLNTGISVQATVSKIVIWQQAFFVISSADGSTGPLLSLCTFTDPSQSNPPFQSPHFLVTGSVSFLGLVGESIYVNAGVNGLDLQMSVTNPLITSQVSATIATSGAFNATVSAAITVPSTNLNLGQLGTVNVATTVGGTVTATASASSGNATFAGTFSFANNLLHIPIFSLQVPGPALTTLPSTITGPVQQAIEAFFGDVNQWLNCVKSQIVIGFANAPAKVGNVLSTVYKEPAAQIASLTKNVLGYGANDATLALQGAGVAANDAVNALTAAGYAAQDVANAVKSVFTNVHADVSLGHIDTPAGPHVDTPVVPHIDTQAKGHIDVGGHTDAHQDVRFIGGPHEDFGAPHGDTSAVPHVDTASLGHVDTQTPPHGDTGTHIDT
jgi:hypothetical protein